MAKNPITHIKDHEQDMSLGGRRGALCGVYYDDDLGERWDDDNPTCKSCRRSSWRRGGNRISPTAKRPITHIKDRDPEAIFTDPGGLRKGMCGAVYGDECYERWDDDNPTCKSCRRSSWRRGGNRISPTAKRPITHIKDRDPEAIFTDPGGLRKGMCGAVYGDECYERWDDDNPSCSKCIRYQNSKARLRKLRRRFRLAAKKAR